MSIKAIKEERDLLRWFVIVMAIFAGWCWMIDIPGTRQIVEDWKNIRFNQDHRISELKTEEQNIISSKTYKEILILKSQIMPSCFIGKRSK